MDSLTKILTTFSGKFYDSIQILIPYAKNLVLTLAVIDTVLSHLKQLEEGNHIHILIWNIMKYGFAYFAISNYSNILMTILTGFIVVGLKAGGSNLTVGQFADPSAIIKLGADLGTPLTDLLQNLSMLKENVGQQLGVATTQLGIELSFIIIAIQVFVITLEFYIIGAVAIIFLPFGANIHTRFLADKVWPAIVACGVKLMVLAFILSIAVPELFIRKLQLAGELAAHPGVNLTSAQTLESLGTSMALAFLCWQAPSMASGLMSGVGSGMSADAISKTTMGMTDMSRSIANSGGGGGVGNMMQGISTAMSKATGNPLPAPPDKNINKGNG